MIDFLGRRYVYVSWSPRSESRLCALNRQLQIEEFGSCDGKCKTVQSHRRTISMDWVPTLSNATNLSARFGNCTGVGPCYDYEYHINNDIALAQWQYYLATGNVTWLQNNGYPVISAVADMWTSLVKRVNSNTSSAYTYQTFNLTDPDEYANMRDNGAFTNAGIKIIMAAAVQAAQILGVAPNSSWVDVGDNIEIPIDPSSDIILEYTGFNGSTPVKQGIFDLERQAKG